MFEDPLLLNQGLAEYFQRLQEGEAVFFPDTWYNAHMINPAFPDKLVWVKSMGFPLLKEKGIPKGYVVMHEDITEQKRLEKELEEQKESLRHLYTNFQARIELQRKSIAADLHDNLIQDLTAHKMNMATFKKTCKEVHLQEEMQQELLRVNAMIRKARNILNAIWPTIIDNQGIEAAINGHAESISKRFHIQVSRDLQQGMIITKDISYPLFMIFQEAMTNIVKHARARKVNVSLKQDAQHVHFAISDDGKGIPEHKTDTKKHFGLFMVKDLVNALGGSFTISKGETKGTEINIVVPNNKTLL
jgi:signal transduction histidine kinase